MVLEDHCVHVEKSIGEIMFSTMYIDDQLLAENNLEMIEATKKWLSYVYEMNDRDEVRPRSENNLKTSQEAYLKKALE